MLEKTGSGHRQRMKERFMAGEKDSRTDDAILELLLTYSIPQRDVGPLARNLLKSLGGLSGVLEASHETLCSFDGIKTHTSLLLKLVEWIRSHYPPAKTSDRGSLQETRARQLPLFHSPTTTAIKEKKPGKKVIARRGTEMFSKALLKEAITLLPDLPDSESLDDMREHLRKNLHFSAEQTRHRHANYIVRRMFPEGYADSPLRKFAKSHRDTQALRDVCFYRFLKSEPLEIRIVEDLMLPNLGTGRLNRSRIKEYLTERFPMSRSVKDCAQATVDAMSAAGIAKVDKTRVTFAYREIPLPAFAFVLHSEFPEPGMYDISTVENNRSMTALLWNPDRILPSLYELRNVGIISKVSEIDTVRQFTTSWTIDQVVEHLASRKRAE
jgi:DNA repair protein RadC